MIALLLLASSYGIGSIVLRLCGTTTAQTAKNTVFGTALGLGLWAHLIFALGHFNLLKSWLLLCIAVGTAIYPVWVLVRIVRRLWRKRKLLFGSISLKPVFLVPAAAIVIILGVTFISSFAPVDGGIANDEIEYHLSTAKDWFNAGGLSELPYPVSYLAGHGDLLFIWAYAFDPYHGPRVFAWLCGLLTLLAVCAFTREKAGTNVGLLAAMLLLINPLFFRGLPIGFTDNLAALYPFLAIWCLFDYRKDYRKSSLILSALFASIGCCMKVTNYVYMPGIVLILWMITWLHRERPIAGLTKIIHYSAVAGVLSSLWIIRNVLLTGSPTFPPPLFLYRLLDGVPFVFSGAPFPLEAAREMYAYFATRTFDYGRGVLNFFLLPWHFTMHPESFQAGDAIGTLALSFLPLSVWFIRTTRWIAPVFVFSVCGAAGVYFMVFAEARYFMPIFVIASPVLAVTIRRLLNHNSTRTIVSAVVAINILFSVAVCIRVHYSPMRGVFSQSYRETIYRKVTPFCEAYDFLAKHSIRDVVVLSGNQNFYHIRNGFVIDSKAIRFPQKYRGRYLLDIDYSQVIWRNADRQFFQYSIKDPPQYLTLVFAGPDARVYRFD